MKYFHTKVWLGFLSALAIIIWLAVTSYVNNRKLERTASRVAHTNRVLYHSEQILTLTIDLESGQRGFALTGIGAFLEPAVTSASKIGDHLGSLQSLAGDNPSQISRISRLKSLIERKLSFSRRAIELRKRGGLDSVVVLNAGMDGKNLMDEIRLVIAEIQEEENRLLTERTLLTRQRVDEFNASFAGMLLATIIILVTVFYMIYVSLRRRARAEQSLRVASETIRDIYDNAPCGYHSLGPDGVFVEINQTWLQWLQYTREEVVGKMKFSDILTEESVSFFRASFEAFRWDGKVSDLVFDVRRKDGTTFVILLNAVALYDSAGNFLKSRSTALDYTAQKRSLERIEQLNQELESFSYSVSHDLRAPLRSIDGYTQILIEDYSGSLDDEGKRVLNVVVSNARRMAKLIDDLLDFSRVGRKDVARSPVNVESLVHAVFAELRPLEEGRDISATIEPLENCEADPNLLRQVWVNLLSNALKYTRKREHAEITVSSRRSPGEVIYSVRDNGTGFDMQYAHKLFGVFQRLHRQQDFEGTGVGLAIVHRIISRHGGKVWAEAEAGKGAAFHFSLPNTPMQ